MKKYVAEFIGSFSLIFCGTGAIIINDLTDGAITHLGIATTFGLVVMVMIYTFGNISGAHMNPAVSIAFSFTNRFERKNLLAYILAQLLGMFSASILLKFLFFQHSHLGSTLSNMPWLHTFILEMILTYLLMLVILFVSQDKSTESFTGVAVGAMILLEALFAGSMTGASMNPARSIAPAVTSGNTSGLWIYIFAPILGAVLASLTWNIMQKERENLF